MYQRVRAHTLPLSWRLGEQVLTGCLLCMYCMFCRHRGMVVTDDEEVIVSEAFSTQLPPVSVPQLVVPELCLDK
jgi:hypothetical protein